MPDGPASLGLPALSTGTDVTSPGALVGPDGRPSDSTPSNGTRGALGQAGGYLGFSESLDTSVRGDLGDELVMRVRSPEPAFWRGQTFADFDGRTWTVSPATGRPRQGPDIAIPPTLGDQTNPNLESDELIQTYFVETDLPNVIFAAHRATTLIFDGMVWTRPDGALRSDVTLTEGSVYTVLSQRVRVTPELLRDQGDVAAVFASFDDPGAQSVLAPYLDARRLDVGAHARLGRGARSPRPVDVRHDSGLRGVARRQHLVRPRRAGPRGRRGRGRRFPVRVTARVL